MIKEIILLTLCIVLEITSIKMLTCIYKLAKSKEGPRILIWAIVIPTTILSLICITYPIVIYTHI